MEIGVEKEDLTVIILAISVLFLNSLLFLLEVYPAANLIDVLYYLMAIAIVVTCAYVLKKKRAGFFQFLKFRKRQSPRAFDILEYSIHDEKNLVFRRNGNIRVFQVLRAVKKSTENLSDQSIQKMKELLYGVARRNIPFIYTLVLKTGEDRNNGLSVDIAFLTWTEGPEKHLDKLVRELEIKTEALTSALQVTFNDLEIENLAGIKLFEFLENFWHLGLARVF